MSVYVQTIEDQRGGRAERELNERLRDVIAAVRDTGKAGELTLKLTIRPATTGDADQLLVKDTITDKIPEHDKPETIYFATDVNELSRNDPRQPDMFRDAINAPGEGTFREAK